MTLLNTLFKKPLASCAAFIAAAVFAGQTQAAQLNAGEWVLIFSANSATDATVSQRGFIGELQSASDQYDANDLETLSPIDSNYLAVKFPHQDWPQRAGNYSGDFRSMNGANEWTFEVNSSDANRDVKLTWDTTHAQDKSMFVYLVDIDTNKRIPVQTVSEYQFNMNGSKTKTFMWQSSEGRLGSY